MSRKLQLLFRRDPTRDRQEGKVRFEGYEILWPDGRTVALGLEGLCLHGQRLLSLGRHLAGCRERLIDLICFPLAGPDDALARLPGHRVRRFYIEPHGRPGRREQMRSGGVSAMSQNTWYPSPPVRTEAERGLGRGSSCSAVAHAGEVGEDVADGDDAEGLAVLQDGQVAVAAAVHL